MYFSIPKGLKQGDALMPLRFNFAIEHAVRKVQEKPHWTEINGTHQLLVDVDDVNILGDNIDTTKKEHRSFYLC
jgi:hypothetical protein